MAGTTVGPASADTVVCQVSAPCSASQPVFPVTTVVQCALCCVNGVLTPSQLSRGFERHLAAASRHVGGTTVSPAGP